MKKAFLFICCLIISFASFAGDWIYHSTQGEIKVYYKLSDFLYIKFVNDTWGDLYYHYDKFIMSYSGTEIGKGTGEASAIKAGGGYQTTYYVIPKGYENNKNIDFSFVNFSVKKN